MFAGRLTSGGTRTYPDLIGLLRAKAPGLEPLSIPIFRSLWTGHSLAQLANYTRMMVLAWLTLQVTDSQVWVGLVNGLPALALAFFSLWGGVMSDRSSPRAILLRARLTMALGAMVTAFLASVGVLQVWHILSLSFMIGGIAGMDMISFRVMMGKAVTKDRLLSASALSNLSMNLANILGPSVGGILLAYSGPAVALWIVAGVYVLALLTVQKLPKESVATKNTAPPVQDLVEGLRYTCRTPHVRWIIILGTAAVLAASFFPLVPGHVRDTLELGPEGLGFLMGAFGAGGLTGAMILMTQHDPRHKGLILVLMSLVWAAGVLGLGVSHNLYFSAGCLFVIGVALSIWVSNLNTLLQTTVETAMQGRVFSLNKIMMQMPMAWLLGGLLAEVLGFRGTLVIGVGVFVALHLVAYCRTQELRRN
ncbi:MAG: MFS transporter [Dehalococcoidia bacterium]